jgi:hypothetical protein
MITIPVGFDMSVFVTDLLQFVYPLVGIAVSIMVFMIIKKILRVV